MVAKNQIQTY